MVQSFHLILMIVQKANQAHAAVHKFNLARKIFQKFQIDLALDELLSITAQQTSNHRQAWRVRPMDREFGHSEPNSA